MQANGERRGPDGVGWSTWRLAPPWPMTLADVYPDQTGLQVPGTGAELHSP